MKDKKVLGLFIKEKRQEKNLTQKQLAEILFVTESAVSKWERGIAYPDITLITEICNALDITEHELIEASNDINYRKIKHEAAKYNKIKKTLFWILNISYILALITCFIVNIAVNHTLSWFFIVFASILCAYSFCPTITWNFKKFKLLSFITSSFVSLFILLLTISIYTKNYFFPIPSISILLSYFIIFFPILFTKQKNYLELNKYSKLSKYFIFIYTLGITLCTILLLSIVRAYTSFSLPFAISIVIIVICIPLLYGVFKMLNVGKLIIKITSILLISIITLTTTISITKALFVMSSNITHSNLINESFNDITINSNNITINIYLCEEENTYISYTVNEWFDIEYKVINNSLEINYCDNRIFYEKLFDFSNLKLELYINKDLLNNLTIITNTGDINIYGELQFNDINITSSTGDTCIKNITCNYLTYKGSTCDVIIQNSNIKNDINIKTSTGETTLTNVLTNNADFTASTGDITLSNVIINQNLNILGSTSDVIFNEIDALNITVKLSTGDLEGVIITDKIFIIKTSTGKIIVPECTTGGTCKITTSTGDVNLKIKASN